MTKAAAKTAPKGAAEFKTEDTVVPTRPTTTVTIGVRTYHARAPKMNVWMATGFLLERIDKAHSAQERLNSGDLIGTADRRVLEEAAATLPALEEIHELLIEGRSQEGRINGGFLRRCLSVEDYRTLVADLEDDESDTDIPDVYDAAFGLYREFESWFAQRAENMGLSIPKAQAGTRQRSATARRRTGK